MRLNIIIASSGVSFTEIIAHFSLISLGHGLKKFEIKYNLAFIELGIIHPRNVGKELLIFIRTIS